MVQILRNISNPFVNLTIKQRILQTVRIWFPLIALVFNIVLMCIKNNPLNCYIARINCDHVDLAKGLSSILNGNSDILTLANPNVEIPFYIDVKAPQSELILIRDFTRSQVEGAPQYFLLGFGQYCTFRYDTDYDVAQQLQVNLTIACQEYNDINPLDYINILNSNGFSTILELGNAQKPSLDSFDRLEQLRVFKIVSIIEFVILPLSFLASLYVYCCRQGKKDLSAISNWTLHIPLVLSFFAGVAETCSFAIIFYNLGIEKLQIKGTLGIFGINMVYGPVFMGIMITKFALTVIAMVFWVVPMYCANPPEIDDTDEVRVATKADNRLNARGFSKMSNGLLRRKPKRYAESRSQSPLVHKLLLIEMSEHNSSGDLLVTNQPNESETELRKLGDELSRRPHVRKLTKNSP